MPQIFDMKLHDEIMELLEKYRKELLERVALCKTTDELKQLKIQILGRNGELTELFKIYADSYKRIK